MPPPVIRPATVQDLPAITTIYNHAILNTTATFDTEPKTEAEQMAWFNAHGERHPILVATVDGQVVGWASLSAWSDRCAYRDTAEVSTYVDANYRGRGIGKALTTAIDRDAQRLGFHTLIARIVQGNATSIGMCRALGYVRTGVMREVGFKFGQRLDVVILQRFLGGPAGANPENTEPDSWFLQEDVIRDVVQLNAPDADGFIDIYHYLGSGVEHRFSTLRVCSPRCAKTAFDQPAYGPDAQWLKEHYSQKREGYFRTFRKAWVSGHNLRVDGDTVVDQSGLVVGSIHLLREEWRKECRLRLRADMLRADLTSERKVGIFCLSSYRYSERSLHELRAEPGERRIHRAGLCYVTAYETGGDDLPRMRSRSMLMGKVLRTV